MLKIIRSAVSKVVSGEEMNIVVLAMGTSPLTRRNVSFIVWFICVYWLYRPLIGTYSVSLSTKWIFIAFTLI